MCLDRTNDLDNECEIADVARCPKCLLTVSMISCLSMLKFYEKTFIDSR
jgi:hypothetical protein